MLSGRAAGGAGGAGASGGSGVSAGSAGGARRKDGSDIPSITGLGIRRHGYQAYRRVKKACSRTKRRAKAALIDMTAGLRSQAMIAIKDALKSALADDPDMCHTIRKWVLNSVEDLWQDVEREVNLAVEDARHGVVGGSKAWKDVETLRSVGETPGCLSPLGIRAWVLYNTFPFDKSIFGLLRDPRYWVFATLSLFPDLRIVYYAVILTLIHFPGPPDEYQLVQFILQLKATQFLSSGIGLAFLGGLQYYMCVEESRHTCDTSGPGSSTSTSMTVLDVAGSSLLIWCSFLLLPYSKSAAGLRRQPDDTDADEEDSEEGDGDAVGCCCPGWTRDRTRGGRLNGLLRYDLWCFILSTLFLLCIALRHYHRKKVEAGVLEHFGTWQFQATLYWARVFYSLLALPFFLFNLPILSSILTHTVPTGFNPNGVAVTWLLPPLEEEEFVPQPPAANP